MTQVNYNLHETWHEIHSRKASLSF